MQDAFRSYKFEELARMNLGKLYNESIKNQVEVQVVNKNA